MFINLDKIKLNKNRKEILKDEFQKEYFLWIKNFLLKEKQNWKIIYPKWNKIFEALNITDFDKIKVVILWQDPYHWENQSHWLAFSVQKWIKIPPSLKNIFKELNNDLQIPIKTSWNLENRAKQWILLLNAILTVEKWKPASHKNIWRENFTDNIIKKISDKHQWIVFLLRWNFAISKKHLIDEKKHFIITTTHPSPFSAHKWFLWSKCFSKTNEILKQQWKTTITR